MIRKNQPGQGQSRWLPPHSRSPQQHRTQFASFPSFALSRECSLSPVQNDLFKSGMDSVKAFVKVIGQCQQVFWNLYLIKRWLRRTQATCWRSWQLSRLPRSKLTNPSFASFTGAKLPTVKCVFTISHCYVQKRRGQWFHCCLHQGIRW